MKEEELQKRVDWIKIANTKSLVALRAMEERWPKALGQRVEGSAEDDDVLAAGLSRRKSVD
jgi:hypothetical protein